MKKIIAFISVFFILIPFSSLQAYDIRNDFCGVHINFQYCKCAFHNEYCGAIGLSQDAANSHVQSEFNKWVAQQEAIKERAEAVAECEADMGEWVDDECVLPEEEKTEEESQPEQTDEEASDVEEEGGEKNSAEEECLAKENFKYNAKNKTCECHQLYKKSLDGSECFFNGDDGIRLDVENSIEFQETLEGMEPGEGLVFTSTNMDGEELKIGVVRKPDGNYEFTTDGINYFDNSKDAANPGFIQKIKTGFSNIWRKVKGLFGIDKFVGRGTADDPEKQAEGQARLDASIAAFKDLRAIGGDPEKQFDDAKALESLWRGRAKNLLGEKYDDLVMDELKNASGYDVKKISQVLTGDYQGLATGQIDAIKGSLYTFPADAVETLAKELRKNDFATGASVYMDAREQGKDPAQIYAELLEGQQPRLEYKQLTGVSQLYAQGSMLLAYEDAYQRYLLSKELK